MKAGSTPKSVTKAKRKPIPRAPDMPRAYDLNYWLNKGRKVDRRAMELLKEEVFLTLDPERFVFVHNLPLICRDGYLISVQASLYHYCYPRETWEDASYYDSFELGFPNMVDECLLPYQDGSDDPRQSVYSRVPRKIVEQLLAIHGGVEMLDTSQRHFPELPLLKPGEKLDGE